MSPSTPLRITQVDAFAAAPFAGNPAAVCVLPATRSDSWMQQVAGEMNLSETAFLLRREQVWSLRWFTPTNEVDLCGHATLAAAHVLWEEGHLRRTEEARFETRSGRLQARLEGSRIAMDFPAEAPEEAAAPVELIEAVGVRPLRAARGRYWLLELAGEEEVRKAAPDFRRLAATCRSGVIITATPASGARSWAPPTPPGVDFVSRFFAPAFGVDEDPVTGSAHCVLGPWWGKRLGRERLTGFQASARGGVVGVHLTGDRAVLAGQAVTVLRGELLPAAGGC